MSKNLEAIEKYLIFLTALATPILVLPIFPDYYNTPKLLFLSAAISTLIFIKAAQIIASQKLEVTLSSLDLPILLITISYLASTIFKSPNKMEALFLPGTTTLIVSLALFYFFINQTKKGKLAASYGLVLSSLLTAVVSLISIAGLNQKLTFLPDFARQENFSLTSNNLITLAFLLTIIPININLISKEEKIIKQIILGFSLLVISASTAANLYQVLPGKKFSPKMPPTKISWEIAIDSIKNSPLFGVGAGNYLTAFNRFRPLTYNNLDIWQTKFTNSQNFFLHLTTETGLLGLFAIIILGIALVKIFIQKAQAESESSNNEEVEIDFLKIGLGLSTISLFLSGPNIVNLIIFFTYLALNSENKKVTFSFEPVQKEQKQTSAIASLMVSFPLITGALAFLYFGSKLASAECSYKKGLEAISQNKGQEAFNFISSAINKNPKVDRYHATLAQISFLAAQNIAQSKEADKITDEEKNLISNLIQQAILEGKAAVSLNTQRADNWELLGNLYKQIMAFARGSDQFAIQTLSQAVALDPINPLVRLSLGGTYFAIGDYENAIDAFKLAVAAKPDYANARYNLAVAYREKGELDKALLEMKNTLSLLEEGSNDRQTVEKEIEALETKKKEAKTETKPEELTPPKKTEKTLEPKVNLPEEAAPPSPVILPENPETSTSEPTSTPTTPSP